MKETWRRRVEEIWRRMEEGVFLLATDPSRNEIVSFSRSLGLLVKRWSLEIVPSEP